MMHLRLPNYPQEFVDAYVKHMFRKYIDRIVSRRFFKIIEKTYRKDLENTFGSCSSNLIKSLIKEYYLQEDYFTEINRCSNQHDTNFGDYVFWKIGTRNKKLLQKIRDNRFSNYKTDIWYNHFITTFERLINRRSKKIKDLVEKIENQHFASFYDYFKALILLDPQSMESYVKNSSNAGIGNCFKKIKDLYNLSQQITIMDNYEKINCFMIQNFIDSDSRGLLVCPYCNRNYINTRDRSLGAEMDHFYNKDAFPMFSISLYNFIPSCSTCNHIKLTNNLKINPYLSTDTGKVKFEIIPDSESYKIEIKRELNGNFHTFELTEDMKNDYIDVLKLDEAYKVHVIEVLEMINREKEYNEKYREDLKGMFSGEGTEIYKEIDTLIYGDIIFTSEDDLINKSLGKFKKDVYEKIKGWRSSN
jgi:hypothetical protein